MLLVFILSFWLEIASGATIPGLETRQAPGANITSSSLNIGPTIVEIPKAWNNIFPASDFGRPVTEPIWNVSSEGTSFSAALISDLQAIKNASFLVYDQAFYDLLGVSSLDTQKTNEAIFQFPPAPAYASRQIHDGTVYSPECDCIYFVQLFSPLEGYSQENVPYIWRINNASSSMANATSVEKVYPSPQLTVPNGAYYHEGFVYWITGGNYTTPGGVVRMDPLTLETELVLNNFHGARFNSPDDIVVTSEGIVFFTDGYYGYGNFNDTIKPQLANGVYRWDMNSGNLRQVAGAGSRDPLYNPNGLALTLDEKLIYVTSRSNTSSDPDGQRTIYRYDITDNSIHNGEIFAYTDTGFPDGIKVDRLGNVYGGVTDSVDVFDRYGTLLGKIKVEPGDVATNMQFVGNLLYMVGRNYVYRVELRTTGAQTYGSRD